MKITIDPGAIIINEIDVVIDRADFKVFEVDLHSKYHGSYSYGITDNSLIVLIWPDEGTLSTDPFFDSREPTVINFEFPEAKNWAVVAEGNRYTVRIVLWDNTNRNENEFSTLFQRIPQNFTGEEADRIRRLYNTKQIDELYDQGLGESLEQMRRGEVVHVDPQELRQRAELEISEDDAEMLRKSEPAPLVIKIPGIVIEDE